MIRWLLGASGPAAADVDGGAKSLPDLELAISGQTGRLQHGSARQAVAAAQQAAEGGGSSSFSTRVLVTSQSERVAFKAPAFESCNHFDILALSH